MTFRNLIICAVSRCNLNCPRCTAGPTMRHFGDYQLTMGQLERFIACTRESGYRYVTTDVSGGEPLLWDGLVDGLRALAESGIAGSIRLWTNGLAAMGEAREKFGQAVKHVAEVRLSLYPATEKLVGPLPSAFPKTRFTVMRVGTHRINPTEPLLRALPARCNCAGAYLIGDRVWACGGAVHVPCRLGRDPVNDLYSVPVQPKYLAHFARLDILLEGICRLCGSNAKVDRRVKREPLPTGG